MDDRPHIVVIEQHVAGHHPTYLSAIIDAMLMYGQFRVSLLLQPKLLKHPSVSKSIRDNDVLVKKLPVMPGYKNLRSLSLSWRVFTFRTYRKIASELRAIEKKAGPLSLAFLPCLNDDWMLGFGTTQSVFPYQIGGIYMNSTPFRMRGSATAITPHFIKAKRTRVVAVL